VHGKEIAQVCTDKKMVYHGIRWTKFIQTRNATKNASRTNKIQNIIVLAIDGVGVHGVDLDTIASCKGKNVFVRSNEL
jgi:alkaline phosphatase